MERKDLTGPGIVVIDKPRGPTSHQVTAWTRELLGVPAGHTGTLDPDVSGVLVVMLSTAVRLAPLLAGDVKEYIALMRVHGDVTRSCVEQALGEFSGRIYQRPPRRSAVARALRIRTIHRIDLLELQGRLVLFRVRCDAGTYIRSLCHHVGLVLGTGAHMQELRRTSSGGYSECSAHTLQELADAAFIARGGDFGPMERLVIPAEEAVSGIPSVTIRDTAVDAVCHGAVLAGVGIASADPFEKGERVAIFSKNNELVAIGRALVPSPPFRPGSPGLVIAPGPVFMPPDTYHKGWIKK
jgi:predicted rRNA pseudouridine synthase